MKQYWMAQEEDFRNLRYCLDNYTTEQVFVQTLCTRGGKILIDEKLNKRKFDLEKDDSGLYLLLDSKKIFHFTLQKYDRGFSMTYNHEPNPEKSALINFIDNKMFWIIFDGKIPLKFHSWWDEEYGLKYWTADKI